MSRNMRRGERGVALVIVLWGVTLLSLLAASFAQSTGLAARRMLHVVEAAKARSRLDELLALSVIALTQPEPTQRWRTDGKRHAVPLPGGQGDVRVIAESGRIDLNHAPPILLQSLFRRLSADASAGDHLAAWLAARTPEKGGRPLLSVAELAGFPGMSAALYDRLAPAVTVHNSGGKLNWRFAGKTALAAIPGISDSQIAALLAGRGQSQYTPDGALADLLTKAGASDDQADDLAGGGAKMVTLTMRVTLAGHATASAEALLQLPAAPGQNFRLLEWRAPANFPDAP